MSDGHSPGDRLRLALELSEPGALIFVEENDSRERQALPERIYGRGLERPYVHVDFGSWLVRWHGPAHALHGEPLPEMARGAFLPHFLRNLLAELERQGFAAELLYLDGLERRIDAEKEPVAGGELERLNLAREDLTRLRVAVAFLLPGYVVQLLRTAALNLWTWRAYHIALNPAAAAEPPSIEGAAESRFIPAIPSHDSPEARARRIRLAQRMLEEDERAGRPLAANLRTIIIPLLRDLQAIADYQGALALCRRLRVELEPSQLRDALPRLLIEESRAMRRIGDHQEGLTRSAEAVALLEGGGPDQGTLLAEALAVQGALLRGQEENLQAERVLRRALALAEAVHGKDSPIAAQILQDLGDVVFGLGRLAEASLYLRRTIRQRERATGPDHPYVAYALGVYAQVLYAQGRLGEALSASEHAVEILRRYLGEAHPEYAACLAGLAFLRGAHGDLTEAEGMLRQALRIEHSAAGPATATVATILLTLTIVRLKQAQQAPSAMAQEVLAEVEGLLQRAEDISRQRQDDMHPRIGRILYYQAELRRMQGKPHLAEPLLRRALHIFDARLGGRSRDAKETLRLLADVCRDLKRPAEATALEAQLAERSQASPG